MIAIAVDDEVLMLGALVAAINASQLCCNYPAEIKFYGARGRDESADFIDKGCALKNEISYEYAASMSKS